MSADVTATSLSPITGTGASVRIMLPHVAFWERLITDVCVEGKPTSSVWIPDWTWPDSDVLIRLSP